MEKIILVFYLKIGNMSEENAVSIIEKFRLELEREENIIYYIIPIRDGETKVECINPKLVSEEDYQQAKKVLENNQKVVNEIVESYQKNN